MITKSLRYEQRGTKTSGKIPQVTGLLDRELYLNTSDGVGYFKNSACNGLHRFVTDSTVDGFNYLKFSGANAGDIPYYNGSGFSPSGLNLSSFVTTGQTGSFANSSSSSSSFFKSGIVEHRVAEITITGLRYFNSSYSTEWFNQAAWYNDSSLSSKSNDLPYSFTDVVICGNNSVIINLDNPSWVQPRTINSKINNGTGVCFYSNLSGIYSGYISGDASFYGNSIFSGNVGLGNYSSTCCVTVTGQALGDRGFNSYSICSGNNVISGSNNSAILNGTGNVLNFTDNSAIIGSAINVVSGNPNTLYVNNICVISGGYIYGNVSGTNAAQLSENPFRSSTTICAHTKLTNDLPYNLDITNVCFDQKISFSACLIAAGDNDYYSSRIDGMVRRCSESKELILGSITTSFAGSPSKNLYSTSNTNLDVVPFIDSSDGSFKLKIFSDISNEIDWFAKVDLLKIIKE
jgi:hypothetical protein